MAYRRGMAGSLKECSEVDKLILVLRGGGSLHKDGTTGEGSGGARAGAGRPYTGSIPDDNKNVMAALSAKSYSESAPRNVIDFENKFRNEPIEHAQVVDREGRTSWTGMGDDHSVELHGKDFSDAMFSGAYTHNHPTGNPDSASGFSSDDIASGMEYGLRVFRMTNKYYTHVLIMPRGYDPDRMYNVFKNINNSLIDDKMSGKLSNEEFTLKRERLFAEQTGATYIIYDMETGLPTNDTHKYRAGT